jgi:hypothetical protein
VAVTAVWELAPRTSGKEATKGDRRLHRQKRAARDGLFARERFAAEFDHPTNPGLVRRHWYDSREEAVEALNGPSPWSDTRRAGEPPCWLL